MKEKWCEVLVFRNVDNGSIKRVLVCADDSMRYLALDGVVLAHEKKGWVLVDENIIGWVEEVGVAELEQ